MLMLIAGISKQNYYIHQNPVNYQQFTQTGSTIARNNNFPDDSEISRLSTVVSTMYGVQEPKRPKLLTNAKVAKKTVFYCARIKYPLLPIFTLVNCMRTLILTKYNETDVLV